MIIKFSYLKINGFVQLGMKKKRNGFFLSLMLLKFIQSIPSPKAELFKLWLARVGSERIGETIDPELTIERALETYLKKGYSRVWINQPLQAIQVRKELTDEWDKRSIQKGIEYAILTDEISKAWSGMTTRDANTMLASPLAVEEVRGHTAVYRSF